MHAGVRARAFVCACLCVKERQEKTRKRESVQQKEKERAAPVRSGGDLSFLSFFFNHSAVLLKIFRQSCFKMQISLKD